MAFSGAKNAVQARFKGRFISLTRRDDQLLAFCGERYTRGAAVAYIRFTKNQSHLFESVYNFARAAHSNL